MARADRIARWLARDILRERGAEKTPAAMAAMMPLCYALAEGALRAFAEVAAEIGADFAGPAADRLPVPASVKADLILWEAEVIGDDLEVDGGV